MDRATLAATPGCHCLAARRRARALTRHYDRALRPHGLRATQFSILAALAIRGATPVGVLAEGLGLERTTLTRGAALLERNGWLRGGRAHDARSRRLQLTAAGRRKLAAALPAWRAAQEAVAETMGGSVRDGRDGGSKRGARPRTRRSRR